MKQILSVITAIIFFIVLAGCTPPVGSEAWCRHMKAKDAGDWSANEAADYTKHCLFQKK
ncbi:MAG TPA: DUF3012 domain-containing protein [Gammaproteobacteria bacterium]|mgnify:CR=1 FL=1|nr:DUF3012 domain-containing protein [Gammaproteobacteria bacterium]